MTTASYSRAHLDWTTIRTLADLLALVLADPSLSTKMKQERASAIRAIGKIYDKPLNEIPAHAGLIAKRLKTFTPVMAGMTSSRFANVKSLLRAALKYAGLTHMPGRHTEPLSPAWTALMVGRDRDVRISLSRFSHDCTSRGISPEDVTDEVMSSFRHRMETEGMIKDPKNNHRRACLAWNILAPQVPSLRPVTVPSALRTYAYEPADLPQTLCADIEAYLAHLGDPDIFMKKSFNPLRPASIATRRRQLFEYVSALIRSGYPVETLLTLADVTDPEMMVAALRFIMNHAKSAPGNTNEDAGRVHACGVAGMVSKLAKHWVENMPPTVIQAKAQAERGNICRKLKPRYTGLRDGNRAKLRQLDDDALVERFLTMPPRLLEMARRAKVPTLKMARLVQLAVIVEILLMIPIRLTNLAGLKIDSTILRSRAGAWHISIPGNQVKNGSPIEATLPKECQPLLDLYLEKYRPLLLVGTSDWFFPGRFAGEAKSPDSLRDVIVGGVAKHCGLRLHPHLFRHICALLYLRANPGAYGVIRNVLGHKSLNTTIANYCGTESAQALQHYEQMILRKREEATKPIRRRIRKPTAPAKMVRTATKRPPSSNAPEGHHGA